MFWKISETIKKNEKIHTDSEESLNSFEVKEKDTLHDYSEDKFFFR